MSCPACGAEILLNTHHCSRCHLSIDTLHAAYGGFPLDRDGDIDDWEICVDWAIMNNPHPPMERQAPHYVLVSKTHAQEDPSPPSPHYGESFIVTHTQGYACPACCSEQTALTLAAAVAQSSSRMATILQRPPRLALEASSVTTVSARAKAMQEALDRKPRGLLGTLRALASSQQARTHALQADSDDRYQKALSTWHGLYWCQRCGVVYLPGEDGGQTTGFTFGGGDLDTEEDFIGLLYRGWP